MEVRPTSLAPCWFSCYTITAVHLYFFYNSISTTENRNENSFFSTQKTIAFSLLAESLQFHNNSVLKEILNKKKRFLQKMSGRLYVSPAITNYYA